nr:RICIN domain-containing protein [Ruminococcus bromii]
MKKIIPVMLSINIVVLLFVFSAAFSVGAISKNDVVNKLNGYISQYAGTTVTSSQLYMGSQCKGFANWVFLQIFGVYIGPYPESANYKITNPKAETVGIIEPGNLNENSARELLKKGAPGDYIQVQRSTARGRGPHSMILVNVNNDGIEVFDCNSDGKNTIKNYTISWHNFDVANCAMSLYHAYDYNYSVDVNAPTDVHLDRSQVWYDLKDDIVLYPRANDADSFWISVHKDGQQLISQGVSVNGELRFSASQWGVGDYYAWITASNSAGNVDSVGINFSVVGAAGYNSVSVEKPFYDIDETVSISVSPVCAKGVVIGIDKANVGRVVTEQCDTTFSIAASQLGVGSYSSYFSVYNGSGGVDTSRVSFLIPERKNLGDEFIARVQNKSSKKYFTAVGNNVEGAEKKDDNSQLWKFVRLSDSSYKIISLVDDRALDVDDFGAGGGGTNVQIYNNWDCTAQRFYIYDIYGSYYIKPVCTDMVLDMSQTTNNLEVWGRGEDWAPQKFDIQKTTNIIHPAVSLNKKNYNLDEKVSVSASADGGVDYYGVQVWKGDKVVYQESFTANKLDIDCSKLGAGDYGVFVSCVNNYGSINTETVQFHVTSGITNDIDLDNSVTVADATLLQKYVVGIATLTDDQKLLADCNGDGVINVRDATYIQKTIVKIPV